MPPSGRKYYSCVVCNKRTKPKERRSLNKPLRKYLLKTLFISSTENDHICNKCRHKYYLSETSKPQKTAALNDPSDREFLPPSTIYSSKLKSPPSVSLKIQSTTKSHARCFMCKRAGPKLIVLSSEARFNAFLQHNVLIPAGSRCCPVHVQDGILIVESMQSATLFDETIMNRSSIVNLLKQLREVCCRKQAAIDFDKLSDSDYLNLTGLAKLQFDDLCLHLKEQIRNTPARSARTSIGLFLLKLKSGLSNKLLSTCFNISKSSVRRAVASVRQAMMRCFVPLYLGLESITREDIISKHTTPLSRDLLQADNNQVILVLDGTYIYIQKSNNFYFQRRSYSVYKGRPLVKPMVVVTTTGYFVTIVGPYFADSKNNDAAILNHILKTNVEDIKNFVQENDIFVVDRGFRDSLSLLEDLGIQAEMPAFMEKGQKQMTCEDANNSRLVTKIRWVVESANARIKNWKFLAHVLPTNQVPFIGDYVRIVCSLSNKYFPPLCSHESSEGDSQLATRMLLLSAQVNSLKHYIEEKGLDRKVIEWKHTDDLSLAHFPILSEDSIRSLTCGVYQLKLCSSYIQEHLDGNCDIRIHRDDENLIRVKIQSRHISSKKYLLWLQFNQTDVIAWYCKCRAGARVVGVCAHIAAVVWYLGFARHNTSGQQFGVRNWGNVLTDASDIPEVIDASDSDSDAGTVEE